MRISFSLGSHLMMGKENIKNESEDAENHLHELFFYQSSVHNRKFVALSHPQDHYFG